jgi:hypothetical protein
VYVASSTTEQSTTSTTPVDTDTYVSFTLDRTALVIATASWMIRAYGASAGYPSLARVVIVDTAGNIKAQSIETGIDNQGLTNYVYVDGAGGCAAILSKGTYTAKIQYRATAGTAYIKNKTLHVSIVYLA